MDTTLANIFSEETVRWLALSIMVLIIVGLLLEWMRPARLFLFASVLLVMIGAVSTEIWLQSFANEQVATIALLVAITAALQKNFNIEPLFDYLFRNARTGKEFLWRMSLYVAGISSFLNNTPVVAFMAPYIYNWSKKLGIHPSKLLIPLSFSTILGGMITVIGTSTNLVLNGFIERSGLEPLRFQDFFFLGVSVTVVGIIYLYTWGYQLLPENREAFDDFKEKAPEYTMEAHVGDDSPMIGKTVMEAGLMALSGAYLIEVIREGNSFMASPTLALQAADALIFIGKTEAIMDLVNGGNGLRLPMQEDEGADIVEAVIPANSGLAGQYVINEKFKQQLDAKVVALHRNGEKISGKMENVKLAVGDLLLLSVGNSFFKNLDAVNDLYVLSKIERPETASEGRNTAIFLALMAAILGGLFFQAIDLFTALLFIMAALLGLNLYSVREMKRVVDADLIILLACALTIGDAIIKTGAADLVARGMINVLQPFGVIAIMVGLFAVTVALTSFVTNVAAVSVMFPIAFSITTQMGIDGRPLFVLLAFAASAAFLTPVGYQTNWMVYGPGGYTPKDFLRVGSPLLLLYAITCFIFVITYYGIY